MQIFFKLNTSQEVPHLKFNTPPIEFFFRKFLMCILWVVDQNLFDIPLQIIIIFCFFFEYLRVSSPSQQRYPVFVLAGV